MQDLTGSMDQVEVPGTTVREVIESLEARFPGIKARLYDGDRLRPTIAVIVDGVVSGKRERARLETDSEVHFLPSMSGGVS